MDDEALLKLGEGLYSEIRHFAGGRRAWLCRFVFTAAILEALEDDCGYRNRWCYSTMADARRALHEWDGTAEPEGWHRHIPSGRRRSLATGREWVQP